MLHRDLATTTLDLAMGSGTNKGGSSYTSYISYCDRGYSYKNLGWAINTVEFVPDSLLHSVLTEHGLGFVISGKSVNCHSCD